MLVMSFGIVILVRLPHQANAKSPMIVTLSGIVILIRLSQCSNAHLPILVTPFSMITFLIFLRFEYHGTSELSSQLSISPVPLIVSVPL